MAVATFSYQQIYRVVAGIPSGRVATYGQVARLAGLAGRARAVGYALSALDGTSPLPWHRVVNAAGAVSPRSGGDGMEQVQRMRLQREGVAFDARGRVRLADFGWQPAEELLRGAQENKKA